MELISEINFGLNSTPIKYSNSIKKNYQRVVSEGFFNYKDQIYLYSLNEKGAPGFDLINPIDLSKVNTFMLSISELDKVLSSSIKIIGSYSMLP